MFKVKIEENSIFQDGTLVGSMTNGGPEIWLTLKGETIARFKYGKPKANAKDFVKYVLARATVSEVIVGCKAETPLGWAKRVFGYENLNTRVGRAKELQRA